MPIKVIVYTKRLSRQDSTSSSVDPGTNTVSLLPAGSCAPGPRQGSPAGSGSVASTATATSASRPVPLEVHKVTLFKDKVRKILT